MRFAGNTFLPSSAAKLLEFIYLIAHRLFTAPRARVAVATGITIVLVAIAIAIVRLVLHRVAVCPPVPRASVARRRHGAEDFDSSQNPPRRGTHAPITTHHES